MENVIGVGHLAIAFADLVRQALNSSFQAVVSPSKLKQAIEKWAPQFMGYRQQDSQEFLRFMLDGLSEDLNRVSEKKKWDIKDEEMDSLNDNDKSLVSWNISRSISDSAIIGTLVRVKIRYFWRTITIYCDMSWV